MRMSSDANSTQRHTMRSALPIVVYSLICCMFLLSCNREYSSSIQNGLEMRTYSLNRLKKDTSFLTVEFYNVSSDTLIFPYQNSKYNVVAESKSSGLRENPSVTM